MAIRVHRPGKVFEFILEADRESAQPTVFDIRPLSWEEDEQIKAISPLTPEQSLQINAIRLHAESERRGLSVEELARINEIAPADREFMGRLTAQMARAAGFGLAGVRNLVDLDGAAIEAAAADVLRMLSADQVRELGAEVIRITRLSAADAKN